MNDRGMPVGFGSIGVLGFWSAPLRFQPLQANSIREDETALCLDCNVAFSVRNRACPKCDGEHFWLIANWRNAPARPAARLAKAAAACA